MRETCEMRRAREYGIDAPTSSNTATGYSPLAEHQRDLAERDARLAAKLDPEPLPANYLDPITYALMHSEWEHRNA